MRTGGRRFSRVIPTSEKSLRTAFEKLEGDVRVHIEAGELPSCVGSILSRQVAEVVVSHPRSLARIGKDAVKDDKVDAGKLAELLRLGRIHEVYCEQDNKRRTFRHLVAHHEQMSREQARQKSKIKARLRTLGVIRKDAKLFSASGQSSLLESIESTEIQRIIAQLFAVLNRMIEYSRKFAEVRRLQTAPGVGVITACRFVGYLQTPRRFSNKRKLWRYCRLGITRRESNGKRLSHPRLDNAGAGSLKDVSCKVFEASRRCKGDNSFKRCYEQSLENTKNQVHARLATQRKILACLRSMWIANRPYRDGQSG